MKSKLLVSFLYLSLVSLLDATGPNWHEIRSGNIESAGDLSAADLRQLSTCFSLLEWWVEKQVGGETGSRERENEIQRQVDALLINLSREEIVALGKLIGRIRANEQLAKTLELQSLYASSTLQLIIHKEDWRKMMTGFEATEKNFEFALSLRNGRLDPLRSPLRK